MKKLILIFAALWTFTGITLAQEARLLRFPAVHGDQVVFSYAGNLYTVDRNGGTARKLTSDTGYEMFPHFSHDGSHIAFTAQYDGNTEVYTMPAEGGIPKRITYTATIARDDVADRMGPNNIVMGWTRDDQHVIYRGRSSSFNAFKGQLFKAPLDGDLSEALPFSSASWASFNEDGSKIAMNRVFREFRTWKYYEGGMADDVWIFDTKTGESENITQNPAQDIFPMYYKTKVYFLSDRDRIMNLFEYDTETRATRQVTHFDTYDCKFPSLGDRAIAFENGGYIYLYDLEHDEVEKVEIQLSEDLSSGRNSQIDASKFISRYSLSPDGKRAVFGARGDIFTIPEKSGVTRNLTNSSGAHDRNPRWSPDGKWIAYISDQTGEDELYIHAQDGAAPARALTKGGGSYKFHPVWSPDSKYILLADRSQRLHYINADSGEKTLVVHSEDFEITDYTWAPDSKWIAYTRPGKARRFSTIRLHNIETGQNLAVTDEWYNSSQPVFSPDGQRLYFVSQRDFSPIYSHTEWNHAYVDMSKPYIVTLSDSADSYFMLENDEVRIDTESEDKKSEKSDDEIRLIVTEEGIKDRIESLPVASGNYYGLVPVKDGVYYTASSRQSRSSFKYFDLKEKKETDLGNLGGYVVSQDLKKILFRKGSSFYLENLNHKKIASENRLKLDGMKVYVDQKAEWEQIFNEKWRQMRDYFYDPGMHGVDWEAIREKYAVLVPYANHRNDLTYIIGEMIGELNAGHSYVNDGDRPKIERIPMGMLGAVFSRDKSGYYRIDSILRGESWDKSLISPLRAPGVSARKGDFLIAINGKDVRDLSNMYEALIGKADQVIEITLNSRAAAEGAKDYLVKPIRDESQLYYHEWVQQNIAKVSEASDGRIGYLHIPDMGPDGLNQFARYFYPQLDKEALIIDDRGNGGGNVSPMIIERLRREPALGTMMRNNLTAGVKPEAQIGPKVCLIDQYSASDGDLFPYQFKFHEIGPLIGQRTWGGVVGIRGSLPFIDGGDLRKPEFAHFAIDGSEFIIEGYGVDPDIEVINDPHEEWKGYDAQLKKGIEYLLEKLEETGPQGVPSIPDFPDKSKKD